MILDLEETFTVGKDTFFSSFSPIFQYGVIFEDDLTTGYLYAIVDQNASTILDALHIYNVADVIDKEKPSVINLIWTDDGERAGLFINDYCHAIFDFKNKTGYCRTAFPECNGEWRSAINDRKLTDELVNSLLKDG